MLACVAPAPAPAPRRRSVLVVGGGVSGLASALYLARAGHDVELREGAAREGGLLAPVPFRGRPCDQGSHRVHPAAHPLLRELVDVAWLERPRRGRLVVGGRGVPYPPDPLSFLVGLGPEVAARMLAGFLLRPGRLARFRAWDRGRAGAEHDEGFGAFVRARVGQAAYDRFYRPYAEKVWGDPEALSRTVAKQRVSTGAPARALLGAMRPGGRFLYPRHGMAGLVTRLGAAARAAGVRVRVGRPVTVAELERLGHDLVVWTGHLDELAPGAGLAHRGLYLVHLAVPAHAAADHDTHYTPDRGLCFGRVSRVERFSPALAVPGEALLCVEIPEGEHGAGRDFAAEPGELVRQLVAAGILVRPAPVIAARQTYLPRIYPRYPRGWLDRWQAALAHVRARHPRVLPLGRQGLYLHCNVDHCVRMAADLAAHLGAGGHAAGWIDAAGRYLDLRVRD